MLLIRSLFVVLVFGFQQSGTFAEDLGTYSTCFSDHMLVEVDLIQNSDLVLDDIHLNDVSCKKTSSNASFAAFKIPLFGCGTIRDGSDPDYLSFSNTVQWSPKPASGQLQTRQYRFESRITCRYPRNGTVSTPFKPVEELKVSQTVYGTFSFSMDIFKENEREFKRDLDIPVIPGTPLYFRVQVVSPDSDLVLHLSKCLARNRELDGPPAFIEKGCNTGNDKTLEYQCNPSSAVQDFHLNAFRILIGGSSPDNVVFFLCDVIVCLNTANASICKDRCDNCTTPSQGGGGGTGRRRRSVEEEANGYDTGSKIYSLAIGPFSIKEKDDGKDLKNQEDVDKTDDKGLSLSMILVLCVTSLVAVAMICGTVVVVVMYKKWVAKHDGRIIDSDTPPATKPRKPKVLKL